jgi:hypothetical protein
MKGKLEFNLPEEQTEFIRASRADIAWNKLYDIDMQLRNWIKHGHDFKSIDDLAQHIRTEINEALGVIDE